MRSGNPPPGCGGVAPGTRRPWAGARPHGKAQSVFWFNKNCAVPIWEKDGLPCTIHLHDVVAISSRHTKTGMQEIRDMIYTVRGQQVMLDSDLAELYEVETGALNRAAKRNEDRFPEDFRFRLTDDEYENLRCQIGTSSDDL